MSFPNRSFSLASFQTDAHRVRCARHYLLVVVVVQKQMRSRRSRRTSHIHFMTFPFDCIVYALASANKTSTILISFHFISAISKRLSMRSFPFATSAFTSITTISYWYGNIAKLEKFSSSSYFYGLLFFLSRSLNEMHSMEVLLQVLLDDKINENNDPMPFFISLSTVRKVIRNEHGRKLQNKKKEENMTEREKKRGQLSNASARWTGSDYLTKANKLNRAKDVENVVPVREYICFKFSIPQKLNIFFKRPKHTLILHFVIGNCLDGFPVARELVHKYFKEYMRARPFWIQLIYRCLFIFVAHFIVGAAEWQCTDSEWSVMNRKRVHSRICK